MSNLPETGNDKNEPVPAKRSGRQRLVAAGAALFLLLILLWLNTAIVLSEGWYLLGFPHSYQLSALQEFYDREVGGPSHDLNKDDGKGEICDNSRFSPLYPVGKLLGRIGWPTPPWFRLVGGLFLIAIFLAAYYLPPPPIKSLDRLLTAALVATTPVVLFACRYLEDHPLHILILLIGAGLLLRSSLGAKLSVVWPLYLLPAVDFLFMHMLTNFMIAMMCLAGMILYALVRRIMRSGPRALLEELPRWLLAAAALMAAFALRYDLADLPLLKDYYGIEAAGYQAAGGFIRQALAYPQVLVLGLAGPFLVLLATLNFSKRLRGDGAGLFISWLILPLLLLSTFEKKNTIYAWYLAPAIALLAAAAARQLAGRSKRLILLVCVGLACLHPFSLAAPLQKYIDLTPWQTQALHPILSVKAPSPDQDFRLAQAALSVAVICPNRTGPLIVFNRWLDEMEPVYFALLSLDRSRPYWSFGWFRYGYPPEVTAVEIVAKPAWVTGGPNKMIAERIKILSATHSVWFESERFRVWCAGEPEAP